MSRIIILLILTSFLFQPAFSQSKKEIKLAKKVEQKLETYQGYFQSYDQLGKFFMDSIFVNKKEKIIELYFGRDVSFIPLREAIISEEICAIKSHLGRHFRKFEIILFSEDIPLITLVPNYFKSELEIDSTHFNPNSQKKLLYKRLNDAPFPLGLDGNHIALWHSHGRYYESKLDRWEWQRARLHSTVEDILPMSFVLPYLSRMLENAGAITFIPRERDHQRKEIIIDDDHSTGRSKLILNDTLFTFERLNQSGFLWKDRYKANENPFHLGSFTIARTKSFIPLESLPARIASYQPDIPKKGKYAVYISYGKNKASLEPVIYRIHSLNGIHEYEVDQSMGHGTWIYLGSFTFEKGVNISQGVIEVFSKDPASIVTLDAIKIGGGMGNIARRPGIESIANLWSLNSKDKNNESTESITKIDTSSFKWKISNMPRYLEAARYFLQYSGMPDSLVYNLNNNSNDYNDDYQSRGEWVNYLMGIPNGPEKDRMTEGLGIPIDLSVAFHTDAGVASNDTIIGTLGIYSTGLDTNKVFPNGQHRLASRELTDIIQSQIVDDIKKKYNPNWTRRGIWDKAYSEAYRMNVPAILLELLSHQNLADMIYAMDPRFRFQASRSIYKGILKYLSYIEQRDYVIQPLAVDHLGLEFTGPKKVKLKWKAVIDPQEESAQAKSFEVYVQRNQNGFRRVTTNTTNNWIEYELESYDDIYSFYVTALNEGGRSFPSEILSTGVPRKARKTAIIINAFDRISGPEYVDKEDFAGFALWEDQGVPDKYELSYVGNPYDFDRKSPWLDDDSPGWGASHSDMEGRVIRGNTFDFPYKHGSTLMKHGIAFVSSSDENLEQNKIRWKDYDLVDIIFGEEKTTDIFHSGLTEFSIFTPEMMGAIQKICSNAIPLFISGAHIGSDAVISGDENIKNFINNTLHYKWRSNHADRKGKIIGTEAFNNLWEGQWTYNAGYHPDYYTVESPDAIEPHDAMSQSIIRYKSSNSSAGIAYSGDNNRIVALGFPFESVLTEEGRDRLMSRILAFLFQDY